MVMTFMEAIERANKRIGDRPDFLSYAILEEISSPYVAVAALLCSFPLSLTDDLAIGLLNFVSRAFSRQPGDIASAIGEMAPVLVDMLRSSSVVINGSDGRWRYEPRAREYFLKRAEQEIGLAKAIHRWLLNYYSVPTPVAQDTSKREAWTRQIHTAYHQTPLEPKTGAQKYADLFGVHRGRTRKVFRERISTLVQEQADWLESYSVDVLFYQGMASYEEGSYEEAKDFFQRIHESESLITEARPGSNAKEVHDWIATRARRYKYIAVARHLLGNIIEHESGYDETFVEILYRDSLEIGKALDNRRHVAHVEKSLGDLLARRTDSESLTEAESLFRRSLEYDEQRDYGVASTQLSLGKLLFKMGSHRYDEAIARLEKGLEKAHRYHLKIRLRLALGRVLIKRGEDGWADAEREFAEALRLSRKHQDTRLEIQTLDEMMSLAIRREDEASQLNIREQLSEAHLKRGSELVERGDWTEAIEAYAKHIRLIEEREDTQAIARAGVELGIVYLEQEDFESARTAFEKVLSADPDELTKAEALLGLGRMLNSTQRWEEATPLLEESLAIFDHLEKPRGVARCNLQLGQAYKELSRLRRALRKLETARQSFEELGAMYDAARAAVEIAETLESMDLYSEALQYARLGLGNLVKLGHEDVYEVEELVNSLKRRIARKRRP
jgi:tetratricopeptide (TPR) repeat protein